MCRVYCRRRRPATGRDRVGDDEADAPIKLARMALDFGHHPARLGAAYDLIGVISVESTRLVRRSAYWSLEQIPIRSRRSGWLGAGSDKCEKAWTMPVAIRGHDDFGNRVNESDHQEMDDTLGKLRSGGSAGCRSCAKAKSDSGRSLQLPPPIWGIAGRTRLAFNS